MKKVNIIDNGNHQVNMSQTITANKLEFNKISSLEWLSDLHINNALEILRESYPCIYFMDPLIINTNNQIRIDSTQAVFILHCGNHWITVSNMNKKQNWTIFDSMNDEMNMKYVENLFRKISNIEKEITVNYAKVQNQISSNDCGLFALAFTITLCIGRNPCQTFYLQSKMRDHYNKSIKERHFSQFPFIESKTPVEFKPFKIILK